MKAHQDNTNQLNALKAAFESFNAMSGELQTSYQGLQLQVVSLENRLAEAQREREEEARRNAELARRLSALLEALPGGVVMLDESGVVREINAAATNLLGNPLQDTQWQAICHRAFVNAASEQGDLTLNDGRRITLAQKEMKPDPGRVLLLTDVTENRKFQELLNRHRRLAAMGEMAAALAHQIRTPLSAALLYTSNASRPELSAERRTEILDKATHCLTDLEQLIGDMLQFARGAGRTKDFVSLEELMSSIDVSLRPALKSGQSMKIDLPESAIQMSGNREALTGAVLNLANNALQAAGDQAQVEITGRPDGAFVEICVADNGPGIAPEKVGKIFDPFYTSRPDGTGLGLAVVKSVTESHGGEVYVDETTPRGTKFVMRLPVAEAAADDIEGEHETIAEGAAA